MRTLRKTAIRSLCIGALLVATAAPAFAQDAQQEDLVVTGRHLPNDTNTISMRVSFSDLDLSTRSGRSELSYRIEKTAADICTKLRSFNELYADYAQCRDDAYNNAMQRVGTRYQNYTPSYSVRVR